MALRTKLNLVNDWRKAQRINNSHFCIFKFEPHLQLLSGGLKADFGALIMLIKLKKLQVNKS